MDPGPHRVEEEAVADEHDDEVWKLAQQQRDRLDEQVRPLLLHHATDEEHERRVLADLELSPRLKGVGWSLVLLHRHPIADHHDLLGWRLVHPEHLVAQRRRDGDHCRCISHT